MTASGTIDEYDVVIVGHGVSGLSASIAAHESGATPVILEKSPYEKRGGHTRHAGGLFRFPMVDPSQAAADLDLQREPEQYTQQDFYDDLMEVSDGRADHDLCTELVENAYEAIGWLTDHGVGWHIVDHSDEPGFGTTIGSVQADGEGLGVVEALTERIEEMGIDAHYDTEFRGIEMDDDNEVCAAKAVGPSGKVTYEADSIVICAGSYVSNPEKRTRYFGRDGEGYVVRGSRYNTGEALDAAMEDAGAYPAGQWGGGHQVMNDATAAEVEEGRARINGYQYSVTLNRDGERFIDEGEDFLLKTYAKFGQKVYDQPKQRAFVVFDSTVDDLVVSQIDTDPIEAETLRDLFERVDIVDVENALATIQEFNDATSAGTDEFDPYELDGNATEDLAPNKTNWAIPLDEPPYKCFPVRSAMTFAFGGLKITTESQVLDTRQKPIPGLWAVGNSTAEFFYGNYPGGSALSRGATFGQRAGRNAASRANSHQPQVVED
ncbi:FAD-dependent tricarballylate dehydrogenase TcuA [Salinigranum halophilum]|uniref:FAD-dependent tricarballylate dehydrogenase TcuA n=1 Tax=Salinigranum halophilum TaxID=2565931 RepID=UPI0010A76525|nr:FAD-dependent tricarballylate dehydrogenase TcuA [Salinigranum halophilum]